MVFSLKKTERFTKLTVVNDDARIYADFLRPRRELFGNFPFSKLTLYVYPRAAT